MDSAKIARALQLLRMRGEREIPVKEAVEIISLVTSVPELVLAVLKEGESRGLIEREKNKLRLKFSDENFNFERPKVKVSECDANCIKCGKRITSCHFIIFEDDKLGPFGSTCIRKMKLI